MEKLLDSAGFQGKEIEFFRKLYQLTSDGHSMNPQRANGGGLSAYVLLCRKHSLVRLENYLKSRGVMNGNGEVLKKLSESPFGNYCLRIPLRGSRNIEVYFHNPLKNQRRTNANGMS